MPQEYFERLSGLDSSFLVMEDTVAHMHIAATMIFDGSSLLNEQGGIDFEQIRSTIAARLHRVPRYRQRLAFTPVERHPVWVDDTHFNLNYHLRHTGLPRPGDEEQLKRLTGRIMSMPLDRSRPLWEFWIVEGLEGNRMALISKIHHCMIDGLAGVDLMEMMLDTKPRKFQEEPVPVWVPRRVPAGTTMLRDAAKHWAKLPLEILGTASQVLGATSQLLGRPESSQKRSRGSGILSRVNALWKTVNLALLPTSQTPLNKTIGPHRRLSWMVFDLEEVKHVKNVLGGSVNDVILAIVCGGLRRFLDKRRTDLRNLDFRVLAPVSTRSENENGTLGNSVSGWLLRLPLDEPDPGKRLDRIRRHTERLKRTNRALGAQALASATNWTGSTLLSLAIQLTVRVQPFNLVVTNVPGPQQTLYLNEAPLLASFPHVPLFANQALGIALFSYAGKLHWGLNADYDSLPDLGDLILALEAAFDDLKRACEPVEPAPVESDPEAQQF